VETIKFDEKLSNGRIAYERFAALQNRIREAADQDVDLIILSAGRIGGTFLFLCACLPITAQSFGKNLPKIHMRQRTLEKMTESGFLSSGERKTKVIPLSKDQPTLPCAEEIVDEIPVKFSPRLCEDIISRVGEILNNATEHSGAEWVYAGRYHKARRKYCFACYDPGVGIPNKVREYLRQKGNASQITDKMALKWAIESGNSTVVHKTSPRGAGLSLLREFVRLNHGSMRICTGTVLYSYVYKEKTGNCDDTFEALKQSFVGTLFEMDFVADDRRYRYKGESENDNKSE
jgi:hypothetical protein